MKNCFYCEQCGGELEILPNGIGQCIYNPRHRQKIPKENAGKYQRAQVLRRDNKDFESAIRIYEQILLDEPEESAAHWELVLCLYGIEYVKDYNGNYLPTCHRIIEESILNNGDYLKAIEYAKTEDEKKKYRTQAELIDRYQRRIKQIAASEKPYDVFISFKENDQHGIMTPDCEAADKLYNYLTKELKLRTFFSKVSLNGKTGEYEPYIYAALHSAKVMIVVASKREYLDAPWVKNEWSRFLRMLPEAEKSGERKAVAIALVDSMTPEELPSELAGYQATAMNGLGVLERFCHNIDHYIGEEKTSNGGTANVDLEMLTKALAQDEIQNYFELAENFRMACRFDDAVKYYNKVLEKEVNNGKAYWGRLLASFRVVDGTTQIEKVFSEIEKTGDYELAMQKSDDKMNEYYQKMLEQACRDYEKQKAQEKYDEVYEGINKYYWEGGAEPREGISEKTINAMKDYWERNSQRDKALRKEAKTNNKIGGIICGYIVYLMMFPLLYPIYCGKSWEMKMVLYMLGIFFVINLCLIFVGILEEYGGLLFSFGASAFLSLGITGIVAAILGLGGGKIDFISETECVRSPVWQASCGITLVCIFCLVYRFRRRKAVKKLVAVSENRREEGIQSLINCLREDLKTLNRKTCEEDKYGKVLELKDELNLEAYKKE